MTFGLFHAEVPLTNLNRDTIIKANELPLRYTSFTNCFRSEAGASGKDTKGLMRNISLVK